MQVPWRKIRQAIAGGESLPAWWLLAAVALMILPMPTALVDGLLALNITLAILMLVMAVRVADSLRISALPTLLLCATLFRLALNVSTTRLILLHGDAGELVAGFGRFVAGDNPLVGGVIFLILTLVQFIVIAKGSERVAEVSARFALDGMPGKQMGIDAELRAGSLDADQARQRRSALEQEAQFQGAMDGAMKFVKGDAVAGLAITLINLVGGLLVACWQRGLSLDEALSRITILTVGDGLASQIPALLVATAAGLVVTRVRNDSNSGLGLQLASCLRQQPEVLLVSGVALGAMALMPGMPWWAFSAASLFCLAAGIWSLSKTDKPVGRDPGEKASSEDVLVLRLPSDWTADAALAVRLEDMRVALVEELGLSLPNLGLDTNPGPGDWTLELEGVPLARGQDKAAVLSEVELALRGAISRFMGVQECQDILDRLEGVAPALVREVVPRLVPPVLLAEVLARLLEEGVSIKPMRVILGALAEWARSEADPCILAERVREKMRDLITHSLAPQGTLEALLLDPELERRLEEALQASGQGTQLLMSPEEVSGILRGLERVLSEQAEIKTAVVLTRPELRRAFWRLASDRCRSLRVVSYLELEPSVHVRPLGRICFDQA